jgi:cytochrome oxidase Cu insertion factor (SCO1/SenC/PrrC family)
MLSAIRIFAILLLVALGGVWAWAWISRAPGEGLAEAFAGRLGRLLGADTPIPSAGGVQMPQGLTLGGAFTLLDEAGRAVTERDFAGRWMLLYFGFTYCPDVCPTELGTMAAAIDALPAALADRITPVLITIDPERDTPAQLAEYVARFHPRLRGLTGTPEQIAEVARRYRVYYAKARRAEAGDYLMDHSSFIYLVGPDGRVRSLFRPETAPEAIATVMASQLRTAPP